MPLTNNRALNFGRVISCITLKVIPNTAQKNCRNVCQSDSMIFFANQRDLKSAVFPFWYSTKQRLIFLSLYYFLPSATAGNQKSPDHWSLGAHAEFDSSPWLRGTIEYERTMIQMREEQSSLNLFVPHINERREINFPGASGNSGEKEDRWQRSFVSCLCINFGIHLFSRQRFQRRRICHSDTFHSWERVNEGFVHTFSF